MRAAQLTVARPATRLMTLRRNTRVLARQPATGAGHARRRSPARPCCSSTTPARVCRSSRWPTSARRTRPGAHASSRRRPDMRVAALAARRDDRPRGRAGRSRRGSTTSTSRAACRRGRARCRRAPASRRSRARTPYRRDDATATPLPRSARSRPRRRVVSPCPRPAARTTSCTPTRRSLFIFNGFLQSLVGLDDYRDFTGDRAARRCSAPATAAKAIVPLSDTGTWSRYSIGGPRLDARVPHAVARHPRLALPPPPQPDLLRPRGALHAVPGLRPGSLSGPCCRRASTRSRCPCRSGSAR